ncbi:sugar ABC transporter ATP-binding protein [Hyphomicrobium sp. ghe19]|uniref:sugar ABC transporter ATP-binding protein n=1 Tax=Hyphomicrobium sp. ghe19 TaxID=2682968 RepID=UPI0013675056|nr:Galactose/methyl galactoside import ATP-binding protein MglA [Hyphomicrobium sp. ghe19]
MDHEPITAGAKALDAGAPVLALKKISKRYPGVAALADIDFDLRSGEVHILFGENGAGKSTLVRLISGAERPSAGQILFRGKETVFTSVHAARLLGINAVYQEFSLVPDLTVAENIFLGFEKARFGFVDLDYIRNEARAILDRLAFPLNPNTKVSFLSRAEQQMVEIAKAFRSSPSILILDEPTASLTEREAERLFALILAAKQQGVAVLYITHRMGEIRRLGDRITVFRDGRNVATVSASEADDEKLISLMTGRVITQLFPHIANNPKALRLSISHLTNARQTIRDVSIDVRGGEVVGIAGLVGSGKGDIGRACLGIDRTVSGDIQVDGRSITGLPTRKILDAGLYYLPSDRRREGLILSLGARKNIALAELATPLLSRANFIRLAEEKRLGSDLARRVELRPLDVERPVEQFSGGNQQKIMIAKVLARNAGVVIFDEPTVGVDVGTRVAIYGFIRELCENGAAVLLISSDMPEILHLTHRTYVMYRGQLQAELKGDEITQENILRNFFEREI